MTRPHILIVDDDVFIIETLKTYLEILGYRVTSASSYEQATTRLTMQDKVDLVILDYLLPDGSGADVLKSMGENRAMQKPPVIMSSGILDLHAPVWEELRKNLPVGAQSLIQACVSKPYSLDAMDVALHEVLGGDYIPGPRMTRKNRVVS